MCHSLLLLGVKKNRHSWKTLYCAANSCFTFSPDRGASEESGNIFKTAAGLNALCDLYRSFKCCYLFLRKTDP